jgi:hypothetical protein
MCRNRATEHGGSHGASGNCLLRENIAKRATEEADLFGEKAHHDGSWRNMGRVVSCGSRERSTLYMDSVNYIGAQQKRSVVA